MTAQRRTDVVIVGGGLSGILTAANLLRGAESPLSVCIVERDLPLGRGMAYRTVAASHLLNTPAVASSVVKGDPEHFLRWMRRRAPETAPTTFAPRAAFAEYLRSVLMDAAGSARPGVVLEVHEGEVVAATPRRDGVTLELADGGKIESRDAVLAIGHQQPSAPAEVDAAFRASPRYTPSAWLGLPLDLEPNAPVLLIGAGLTMVDTVLGLAAAGHRGRIDVLSRRGLRPIALPRSAFGEGGEGGPPESAARARRPTAARPPAVVGALQPRVSLRRLLGALREVRNLDPGFPVTRFLRANGDSLWPRLSAADQRRFARHLKPFWDNVRYLVPPTAAERFDALLESGQVRLHAGRLVSLQESSGRVIVAFRRRQDGSLQTLDVGQVINCTGPRQDYGGGRDPLLTSLREQGLMRAHPSGMGIDVRADGGLVGEDGAPSPFLFTLGPPCKGARWETTSIGACAAQADALARRLLAGGAAAARVAPERMAVPRGSEIILRGERRRTGTE